ncbi:MAG: GMC oxidoreductase [Pyrinomonadaceae bacterium]
MDEHFDAVIVGSGFGGSVMAYRLAEAGFRVCLLERGKTYPPFSFPRDPYKTARNFWDPSKGLYGLYNVWSFKGSGAVVSSGLGGGSLIYANVIIRKDEKWFVRNQGPGGGYENWPVTRADLDPHYDRVAEKLNIQRYPIDFAPFDKTPKTLAMIEAAEAVKVQNPGWDSAWHPLNLAVSFRTRHVGDPDNPDDVNNRPAVGEPIIEDHPNYHGKTRYTCVLCGECDLGCNTGSKNTLDYTYLSAAVRQQIPADIRTLCEVRSFERRESGGYCVSYVQHVPGEWEGKRANTRDERLFPLKRVTCDRLILSAGTFGTPYLLLKNRSAVPEISGLLGSRFSVNGDLLSFIVNSRIDVSGKSTPRRLDPSFGPVITSAIRLGDTLDGLGDQGRGFYVQDGGYPYLAGWASELTGFASVLRRAGLFTKRFLMYRLGLNRDADLGSELSSLIGDGSRSASSLPVLAMGRDLPTGRLTFDGRHLNCDWTLDRSRAYYDRVRRVVRAIADALDAEFLDNPSYRYLHQVLTAHPLGGCPMGNRAEDGVVDSFGQVFGYEDLFVADGSIIPGPVGPNPSMTIAALADRAADKIINSGPR